MKTLYLFATVAISTWAFEAVCLVSALKFVDYCWERTAPLLNILQRGIAMPDFKCETCELIYPEHDLHIDENNRELCPICYIQGQDSYADSEHELNFDNV